MKNIFIMILICIFVLLGCIISIIIFFPVFRVSIEFIIYSICLILSGISFSIAFLLSLYGTKQNEIDGK